MTSHSCVSIIILCRNRVVDQPTLTLYIQRSGGLQFSSTVQYSTLNSTGSIPVGNLNFQPAVSGVHYLPISGATATFNKDQVNRKNFDNILNTDLFAKTLYHYFILLSQGLNSIVITVFPSAVDSPKAFRVSLSASGLE